jgi:oxygen-independent coproporphyrinogen-3 oxidase
MSQPIYPQSYPPISSTEAQASGYRSLYVHFPFCETKCHYCDFYSLGRERTKSGDADQFELALQKECALRAPELASQLDTIFFGGGTPSMTPPASMARALAPLRIQERLHVATEWTMEANPSSVTTETLRAYRELGVNRVSMGVQAMRDDLLLRLGRVHSRDAALRALEAIFAAGIRNVSVDLLCGVPGQSTEDIEKALEALLQFPITHLSCYLLTLPPHHRMFKELPNEDTQLEHLLFLDQAMTVRGFEHYEISNFARPGFRAQHNLAYWKGHAYLGLGPSAHSYSGFPSLRGNGAPERWKNVSSLHRYADTLGRAELPLDWTERLTSEQLQLERWMLALRLEEGFPKAWLDTSLRRARGERLQAQGLLMNHPADSTRLRLTPRGFAVSDQVIAELA